jgi:uncharacterized membrane protein
MHKIHFDCERVPSKKKSLKKCFCIQALGKYKESEFFQNSMHHSLLYEGLSKNTQLSKGDISFALLTTNFVSRSDERKKLLFYSQRLNYCIVFHHNIHWLYKYMFHQYKIDKHYNYIQVKINSQFVHKYIN